MAQPKFKEYFKQMLDENKKLFDAFAKTHRRYMLNRQEHQNSFNRQGKKIQEVITAYENRLCAYSEKGQYSKYSTKLAEKFRNEVKKIFPLIDFVGVKISHANTKPSPNPIDSLRKIKLN